jgi:hypothetical protein
MNTEIENLSIFNGIRLIRNLNTQIWIFMKNTYLWLYSFIYTKNPINASPTNANRHIKKKTLNAKCNAIWKKM